MNESIETFGVALIILSLVVGLCLTAYYEYKTVHEIHEATKEHNGTCVMKGLVEECSYLAEKNSYTNSYTTCTQNGEPINCSEILP